MVCKYPSLELDAMPWGPARSLSLVVQMGQKDKLMPLGVSKPHHWDGYQRIGNSIYHPSCGALRGAGGLGS